MPKLKSVSADLSPRLKAAVEVLNKYQWTSDQMWLRKVASEMLDAADRATAPEPNNYPPGHDALAQLVSWIEAGCEQDGKQYVLQEAKQALTRIN